MYIDPNTGGMLFQLLAVAFTAVVGVFFIFSGKIRASVARLRRKLQKKEEEPSVEENPAK